MNSVNSKNADILFAGFGGQGVLFAGKIMAYAGLLMGAEVSWLPSYGPEMRGGAAHCSVILSERPVGSPIVLHPSALVAMNQPSFDKFADEVIPGGVIVADSSLIDCASQRTGIRLHSIPATELAEQNGLQGLANMVLIGKLIRETGVCGAEYAREAIRKSVPERKKHLLEANWTAMELGMES